MGAQQERVLPLLTRRRILGTQRAALVKAEGGKKTQTLKNKLIKNAI